MSMLRHQFVHVELKDCCQIGQRNIGRVVRRGSKAEEMGVHVIIQNEAYTSKTCSWCGNMQKIGGSETYNCHSCKVKMDRDENGARGIFLRALLDGALTLS